MIVNSRMPDVIANDLTLYPEEFCYVVYMPIKISNKPLTPFILPDNLAWVEPLLDEILIDDWQFQYWYITVKHMWVDGYGNREGWHIDGFGTDDINYIWSDCLPTIFSPQQFNLSEDHNTSLKEMSEQARIHEKIKPNQLVRLDNTMVHRPDFTETPILRTFIKVSCSNEIYNLRGNAKNPDIAGLNWNYVNRKTERNHPIGDKL